PPGAAPPQTPGRGRGGRRARHPPRSRRRTRGRPASGRSSRRSPTRRQPGRGRTRRWRSWARVVSRWVGGGRSDGVGASQGTMDGGGALPERPRGVGAAPEVTVLSDLRDRVRAVMEAHWREVDGHGYTVPNATVYPWQWLWDSCFHAIIWAELGDGARAVREVQSLFAHQADDGFVPHVTHHGDASFDADCGGRRGTSAIPQRPMYGRAIAELARRGIAVPAELVERARAGLEFLLRVRARDDESG